MPDVTGCVGSSLPHAAESKSTPATSHNQHVTEFVDTHTHTGSVHTRMAAAARRKEEVRERRERVREEWRGGERESEGEDRIGKKQNRTGCAHDVIVTGGRPYVIVV